MGYFRRKLDRARCRTATYTARNRQGCAFVATSADVAPAADEAPAAGDYRRFVVKGIDPDSQHHRGIFIAAGDLKEAGELWREEYERLSRALTWFNRNLIVPRGVPPRAIYWFKPSADDCHRRTYEIVRLLRLYGYTVWMLQARRPGRVVYEDDLQVGAIPFTVRDWQRGEPEWSLPTSAPAGPAAR